MSASDTVPSNLVPTRISELPQLVGNDPSGFVPYVLNGVTYKVQFSTLLTTSQVPPTRTIATGTGLTGGGDLSANRTISVANGGIGTSQLAASGVTPNTYGDAGNIPVITVDATGRITSASTAALSVSGFVPTSRTVTAGAGLTGGGALSSNITLSVLLSSASPLALGTASAGTSNNVSREDHVHPAVNLSNSSQTQGVLPLGRGGTGTSLSPAAGAIVYSTGTEFALTTAGTAGQVLTSGGPGTPTWTSITGTGTVTSVNASGGTTGLTFSGGPITISGTLTLAGTLGAANGGTGLTSLGTGVATALGQAVNGSGAIALTTSPVFVTPTLGVASATSVAMTSGTVTNAPSASTDIVNKAALDAAVLGLTVKAPCNEATTTALPTNTYNNGSSGVGATLTGVATGVLTIDGVAVALNDRVLVKNEVAGSHNGIYLCTVAGAIGVAYVLTRATDSNTQSGIESAFTFIESGTVNGSSGWVNTNTGTITIGTTAITYVQFSSVGTYTAGTGLTLTGLQFSITNTAVTAASYTLMNATVNAQGQLTAASSTATTGSGNVVLATSPTLVTPLLGTPTSGVLTNCTGYTVANISGFGAGVATWLVTPSSANLGSALTDKTGTGVNVFATSPTLVTPLLGTPTSGVLTNCTGYTVANISGFGAGVATWLATPSSANLAAAVTDETGTGALVFATSPTFVTPALGTPASGTLTNCTGYTVANVSGLGAGVATFLATPSSANLGTALTDKTGTGVNVFATSPTLVTPVLGVATATSVNGLTITTTTGTLTMTNAKTLAVTNSLTLAGTDATTMTFPASSATVAGLGITQTFTAAQTFTGSTSVLAAVLTNSAEVCTVSATAATGTINYDVTTQSVLYYTTSASANWTLNVRASSGTSLNTALATGQSITIAFLVTQGASAFYNNVFQIDGNAVTPKWQGGTAPTAGNASGVDVYTYTIVKTGSAAFTVFASLTKFA